MTYVDIIRVILNTAALCPYQQNFEEFSILNGTLFFKKKKQLVLMLNKQQVAT